MAKSIMNRTKTVFWNKVVKIKRLQRIGNGLAIVIPKSWAESMDWTRETRLILQILPYEKEIIITNEKDNQPSEGTD